MNFIGLIVRCKDEPYVLEFVNYYINQGIDKIYIIDDNSNKEIYKDVLDNNKVIIIFNTINESKNPHKSRRINAFYAQIKNIYEWLIYVDMDEYITTKKNINNTIKNELETTFKNSTCIKVPWVIMSSNSIKNNPDSLLQTNVYRWNHDKRHINNINKFRCRYDAIEVKCIFKPRFFDDICVHHPIKQISSDIIVVDSIKNKEEELNVFYKNLREINIQNGYLLCYHYRIVSIENCLNKIKNNIWYKNYKLSDLLSSDHPEIIDNTLNFKKL